MPFLYLWPLYMRPDCFRGAGGLRGFGVKQNEGEIKTYSKLQHRLNLAVFYITSESEHHPSLPGGPWQMGSAWTSLRTALYLPSPRQKTYDLARPSTLHPPPSPSLTVTSSQFSIITLNVTHALTTCASFTFGWNIALACVSSSTISLLLVQHRPSKSLFHQCSPSVTLLCCIWI